MSLMTPEWIEAHNAKVAAFWAEIDPLVAGMTDSQCHEVVKAGLKEGISMNRIAERMREKVVGAWDGDSNVAVGGAMYRAALERLDQ